MEFNRINPKTYSATSGVLEVVEEVNNIISNIPYSDMFHEIQNDDLFKEILGRVLIGLFNNTHPEVVSENRATIVIIKVDETSYEFSISKLANFDKPMFSIL